MGTIFTTSTLETPNEVFNNYINTFCINLDVEIPSKLVIFNTIDAVKPSNCFYTGYFLIRYMTPESSNQTSLDAYISSFCNNYNADFPLRSNFVRALKDLTGS